MNAEQRRLEENKSREDPWHFGEPYLPDTPVVTLPEEYRRGWPPIGL